jgi:hypothetical protein
MAPDPHASHVAGGIVTGCHVPRLRGNVFGKRAMSPALTIQILKRIVRYKEGVRATLQRKVPPECVSNTGAVEHLWRISPKTPAILSKMLTGRGRMGYLEKMLYCTNYHLGAIV